MTEISHAGWCSRKRCIGECWGRGSPEHASVLEETIAELKAQLATAQARVKVLETALDDSPCAHWCNANRPCSRCEALGAYSALSQPPTAEKDER